MAATSRVELPVSALTSGGPATAKGIDDDVDVADDVDGLDEEEDDVPLESSQWHRQTAVFKSWMVSQAATPIKPVEVRHKHDPEKVPLSIGEIMQQTISEQIINDPREYQLELFERAKTENTIAVLDTGTGKTLIAVLLLRYMLEQELDRRQAGQPSKVSFFLVPAVNLVFQQQAVLSSNLDYKIMRLYGAMGIDLWTRSKWDDIFAKNHVLVCTPEVLHICLSHGFIRMDRISLLIFDEAHHAKQQHPYSKIIKDFFDPLNEEKRPRIFGMTASPIDAKADEMDVTALAEELESTLHSRIATTSQLAPLTRHIFRPTERKQPYERAPLPSLTPFGAEVQIRYSHLAVMKRLAPRSSAINAHLGPWCADRFWQIALSEKIKTSSDMHLERWNKSRDTSVHALEKNEGIISQLRELFAFISGHKISDASLAEASAKVKALHSCLMEYFSSPSNYRCIVFVRERHTAKLLSDFYRAMNLLHLRSGSLIGVGVIDIANPTSTLREQVLTLKKFRQGDLNCLFATSVAEEGLDVPSCNLIIRFDPCQTMIQYVQSRGRARHRNSTLIHMIETGNRDHIMTLEDNKRAEQLMRSFCARIPDDRKLIGDEDIRHQDSAFHEVLSTGAKLTSNNAVVFLAHFVSTLPNYGDEPLRPQYVVEATHGGFVCEVVLPTCSPVRGCIGKTKPRKMLAKCSAAYHTCISLLQHELLDQNLLPIYKDRIPLMRNAALGLELSGPTSYVVKHKPRFWMHGHMPERLYGTLVDFDGGLEQPHRPVIILSRSPLLAIPTFPLYLNSGSTSTVRMQDLPGSIVLDSSTLELLTNFALVVFKDLFNKTYVHDPVQLSYWLAPVMNTKGSEPVSVDAVIDWSAIREACSEGDGRWKPSTPISELEGKFMVDPTHGGKRYYIKQHVPHLKATDPNPEHINKSSKPPSVLETTVTLWKRSAARASWDMDQPVFEAERVLYRRNLLAEAVEKELGSKARCFVCPQPLRISKLPIDFVVSCYALPAVVWRTESHLIAEEGLQMLGLQATPSLALEAFTKGSDGTGDWDEDVSKVKYRRGMGKNYERLEFLGDTFLKMSTTIATYIRNPHDTEYEFHTKRMLQLCNQNLLDVALEKQLFAYIRTQSFSRRTWYPEGLKLLEGKGMNANGLETQKQRLGSKTIADVSEAIIGAVWMTHNKPGRWKAEDWDEAVLAVTTLTQRRDPSQLKEHTMRTWADYAANFIVPEWQLATPRPSERHLVSVVEDLLPYKFRNPRLLAAAFTHASMPQSYAHIHSYEQLEFLGDALLDMACVSHLIYNYQDADPQWLTEHKMAMVNNRFLGALCVKLGLHPSIRHSSQVLGQQTLRYVEELEDAESAAEPGAVDYWTTVSDPPKPLADVVEAYVGAVFLDSGFDYAEVQAFFDRHVLPFFGDMAVYDSFAGDSPVARLHRLLGETLACGRYRLFAEEEPPVDNGRRRAFSALVVHERVVGGDVSLSLRYGKERTAQAALRELDGLGIRAFRVAYGCTCRRAGEEEEVAGDAVMT